MRAYCRGFCGLIKGFPAVAAAAAVLLWTLFHPCFIFTATAEEGDEYAALEEEIVILVNEARTEAGLEPLCAVPVLFEISDIRVNETVEVFSHIRPDGTGFNTALDSYKIPFSVVAENIAGGKATAVETFEQWRNSPGHWSAIMNEKFTHIGVGVCYAEGSKYGWYWEQLFIATDEEFDGQYIPERVSVTPVSYGDIDGDGQVTAFDLVLLRKKLNGEIELNELQLEAADCMRDGVLTMADASVLRKYIMGVYDSLPIVP